MIPRRAVHQRVHAASARRPLAVSGPRRHRLHIGMRGDPVPDSARFRPWHAVRRDRPSLHDVHRRTDRSRRLADSHNMGGDGASHYGVGAGSAFPRLRDPPIPEAAGRIGDIFA